MRQYNRIALATLFLLAGAATGLRAAMPDTGIITLPEIGNELGGAIDKINLQASLYDGSGKPVKRAPLMMAQWKKGAWRDPRGNTLSQLVYPLKVLQEPQDPKLQYKLDYMVERASGTIRLSAHEFIPIADDKAFSFAAAFPFYLVSIDVSKLEWGTVYKGLLMVDWEIRNPGLAAQKGRISSKEPQSGYALAAKADQVTANILFICSLNRHMSTVHWADNGKDLRKLRSGLNIVLTQPVCPK